MQDDNDSRAALAQFLRRKREQLPPTAVGLSDGPRRRTSGLRRAEVAVLAGVSTSWYTCLEQGRDVLPSRDVLDSLATVLQMTGDERRYVHTLVHGSGHEAPLTADRPPVELICHVVEMSAASPYPVYACNEYFDLLAWNPATIEWYGDWDALADSECNIMYWLLTSPEARERLVDWAELTRDIVARWRGECARRPGDERVKELVEIYSGLNPEFRAMWDDHEVLAHRSGLRRFHHPGLGPQTLRIIPMVSPMFSEKGVVFHVPA